MQNRNCILIEFQCLAKYFHDFPLIYSTLPRSQFGYSPASNARYEIKIIIETKLMSIVTLQRVDSTLPYVTVHKLVL